MSKLVQITVLLMAFAVQTVTASTLHCSMDFANGAPAEANFEDSSIADMHAKMGHGPSPSGEATGSDMVQMTGNQMSDMDCCQSLVDCPMGACSSPAMSYLLEFESIIKASAKLHISLVEDIQSYPTNLFRPPISA